MKSHLGILRIVALFVLVTPLFAGGESQSADTHSPQTAVVSGPVEITPTTKQAGGGALVLGAYGFLLILRRRNLR